MSVRVTDTVYLDGLPPEWKVEAAGFHQSTPGSRWLRRHIGEVTSLETQSGFEYLRIGDTHRFHETELWCTCRAGSCFDDYYSTPSGRAVWRRHRPSDLIRKLKLP